MDPVQLLGGGSALVVIVGGIWAAWRRWMKPVLAEAQILGSAAKVTLLGHPEVRDPGNPSRILEPARPGALDRLGNLEDAVRTLTDNDARLSALETTVAEHGQRLTAIEAGHQVERSLGHVANASAFSAIEAAARKSAPDPKPEG